MSDTIKYRPAGFWLRLLAVLIDGIILGLLIFIPVIAFVLLTYTEPQEIELDVLGTHYFVLIFSMLVQFGYYYYLYSRYQATLGKMIFKMRVVNHTDPENLGSKNILIRVFVMSLLPTLLELLFGQNVSQVNDGANVTIDDISPISMIYGLVISAYFVAFNLINPFVIGLRNDKRGLHDMIAGTRVIEEIKTQENITS